jgi:hypothetical protein
MLDFPALFDVRGQVVAVAGGRGLLGLQRRVKVRHLAQRYRMRTDQLYSPGQPAIT